MAAPNSSGGCRIVKKFHSYQEVHDYIKTFEVETEGKFIFQKSRNLGKHDLQSLAKHKIWWYDPDDAKLKPKIPYEGSPYVILGTEIRQCRVRPIVSDISRRKQLQTCYFAGHLGVASPSVMITPNLGQENQIRPRKIPDCSARIRIRNILRFPEFKVKGQKTASKQRIISEKLRTSFSQKTEREYCAYVYFPDFSEHQCHLNAKKSPQNKPDQETTADDDMVYLDGQEGADNSTVVSMENCDEHISNSAVVSKQSTVHLDSSDSLLQESVLSSCALESSITTPDSVVSVVVSSSASPVDSVMAVTVSSVSSVVKIKDTENAGKCKNSSIMTRKPKPVSVEVKTVGVESENSNSIEGSFIEKTVAASSRDHGSDTIPASEKTAVVPVRNSKSSRKTDSEENEVIPSNFVETVQKVKTDDASQKTESSVLKTGEAKSGSNETEMLKNVDLRQHSEITSVMADSFEPAIVPSMTTRSHAKSNYRRTKVITLRYMRSSEKLNFSKVESVTSKETRTRRTSAIVNTADVALSSTRTRRKLSTLKTVGVASSSLRTRGKLGTLKTAGVTLSGTRTGGNLGTLKTAGLTSGSTRTHGKLSIPKTAGVTSSSLRIRGKLSTLKTAGVTSNSTRTRGKLGTRKTAGVTSSGTRTDEKFSIVKTTVVNSGSRRTRRNLGTLKTAGVTSSNTETQRKSNIFETTIPTLRTVTRSRAKSGIRDTASVVLQNAISVSSDTKLGGDVKTANVPLNNSVEASDVQEPKTVWSVVSLDSGETADAPSRTSVEIYDVKEPSPISADVEGTTVVHSRTSDVPSRNEKPGYSNLNLGNVETSKSVNSTTKADIVKIAKVTSKKVNTATDESGIFFKIPFIEKVVGSPGSRSKKVLKFKNAKESEMFINMCKEKGRVLIKRKIDTDAGSPDSILTPAAKVQITLPEDPFTLKNIMDKVVKNAPVKELTPRARILSSTNESELTSTNESELTSTIESELTSPMVSSTQTLAATTSCSRQKTLNSKLPGSLISSAKMPGSLISNGKHNGSVMSKTNISSLVTSSANISSAVTLCTNVSESLTSKTNNSSLVMSSEDISGILTSSKSNAGSLTTLGSISSSLSPSATNAGSLTLLANISGLVTPRTSNAGSLTSMGNISSSTTSRTKSIGSLKSLLPPSLTSKLNSAARLPDTLTLDASLKTSFTSSAGSVTSSEKNSGSVTSTANTPVSLTCIVSTSSSVTSSVGIPDAVISSVATITSNTNSSACAVSVAGLVTSVGLFSGTSNAGGLLTSSVTAPLMSYLNVPGAVPSIPNIPFFVTPTVPVNTLNPLTSNLNVSGLGSVPNVPGILPGYLPPNVNIPIVLPSNVYVPTIFSPNTNLPNFYISNNMNIQNLVKSNLNIVSSSSSTANVTVNVTSGTNTLASVRSATKTLVTSGVKSNLNIVSSSSSVADITGNQTLGTITSASVISTTNTSAPITSSVKSNLNTVSPSSSAADVTGNLTSGTMIHASATSTTNTSVPITSSVKSNLNTVSPSSSAADVTENLTSGTMIPASATSTTNTSVPITSSVKSNLNTVSPSSSTADITGNLTSGTKSALMASTANTLASVTNEKAVTSPTSTVKGKDSMKSTSDIPTTSACEKSLDAKSSGAISNTETLVDAAQDTAEDCITEPVDSANEYPENVVMSLDSKPLYKFKTVEEAYDFIDDYEVETMTQFSSLKSRNIRKTDVDTLDGYKIWYYNDSGCVKIPSDGTPFVIMGYQDIECHFGRIRNNRKLKVPGYKQRNVQSKKQNCPAIIHMRNILRFPEFKIEDGKMTKFRKRVHTVRLTQSFSKDTLREHFIYVCLPDISEHKHPSDDKVHGQRLDKRIVEKIHELAGQGITKPNMMKPYLNYFVQTELQPKYSITFTPENKRFNPDMKDIRNHINRTLSLNRKLSSKNSENVQTLESNGGDTELSSKPVNSCSTDDGPESGLSLIPLRYKCFKLVKEIETSLHKISDLKALQAILAGLQETAKFVTMRAKQEEGTLEEDSSGPTKPKQRKLMAHSFFKPRKALKKSTKTAVVNSPTKKLVIKSPIKFPFDRKYATNYLTSPVRMLTENVQIDGTYDMEADTVYLDSSLLTGVNFNDSDELREAIENILGNIDTSEQNQVENT